MTELDRMILAARQIGEVVGEDLFRGLSAYGKGAFAEVAIWDGIGDPIYDSDALPDDIALDLLTARVWRAVWEWSRRMKAKRTNQDDLSGNVTQAAHGIGIHWRPEDVFGTGYSDLPAAVAAIHKHWQESHNA